MAVIDNTLNAIGDELVINSPIDRGASDLTSYSESITGLTATRTVDRQFSYTTDGIHWSDYAALTNANLQAIPLDPTYSFQLRYKYTRTGTDDTGSIEVNSVSVQGNYVAEQNSSFDKSVFKYFFSSSKQSTQTNWNFNVLNKLYSPGIVSKVLTRGESRNANEEDRDYIDFWRSVTDFFGHQVQFVRKFEQFDTDERLLKRYLNNSGLIAGRNRQLDEMQYLMNNLHQQIALRGTMQISSTKSYNGVQVDGELRRVINYSSGDELLFAPSNPLTTGWLVNVNSPLNRYIHDNKFLEKISIDQEVVLNETDVLIGTATAVDKAVDYELCFEVKGDSAFDATIEGFDNASFQTDLISMNNNAETVAVSGASLPKADEWYTVRIIAFASDTKIGTVQSTPDIGQGNHMKWPKDIASANIKISMQGGVGESITVKNAIFKPLNSDYGRCFVNAPTIVETWMKNNGDFSDSKVTEHMRAYLIPHHVGLINNFLEGESNNPTPITKNIYEDKYEAIYQ